MDTFSPRLDILPAVQRKLWPELRPVQKLGFFGKFRRMVKKM